MQLLLKFLFSVYGVALSYQLICHHFSLLQSLMDYSELAEVGECNDADLVFFPYQKPGNIDSSRSFVYIEGLLNRCVYNMLRRFVHRAVKTAKNRNFNSQLEGCP
jgi:hypothetical protein